VRRVAGIVLAGMAVSVLAACGGGSSKSTASGSANRATGLAAYTSCLSQHGVTLPSFSARARPSGGASDRPSGRPSGRPNRSPGAGGGFGGGGFGGGGFGGGGAGGFLGDANNPPQGVDAATWKAALTACQSVRPTFNGGQNAQNNSAFTAYRNCLSDHGVTMSTGPNGMQTSDPKVAAALKTCAPLRPTQGSRPTTAPSPNS
jgi:hypothetical protein